MGQSVLVNVKGTMVGATEPEHEIAVVGYGTTPEGIPYWIGRNSWGHYWGHNGFFRIVRKRYCGGGDFTWGPLGTWKEQLGH